ncbi:hypothetical protein MBT42_37055 [Streptomyces sp. MBT42]|uniref:hypothetical protein n=1 Tax=Streptomyces sp. MBT42 TaxID=1488373 RepID=UPI001E5A84E5|nr:hypothetical protein [Streptomyces sp. MBT42]MCD2469141.1 hypothetical protein [Streptomyces sp. MBT42]
MARRSSDYGARHDPDREAGYAQVTWWTNDVLAAARKIYQGFGFTLADEERHHSYGHDLVGQNWTLDLRAGGVDAAH